MGKKLIKKFQFHFKFHFVNWIVYTVAYLIVHCLYIIFKILLLIYSKKHKILYKTQIKFSLSIPVRNMKGLNLNQRVFDISVTICFQCIISQLIAPRPVEKGPSQSYPPRDRTLDSEEAAGCVNTSATRQIRVVDNYT